MGKRERDGSPAMGRYFQHYGKDPEVRGARIAHLFLRPCASEIRHLISPLLRPRTPCFQQLRFPSISHHGPFSPPLMSALGVGPQHPIDMITEKAKSRLF